MELRCKGDFKALLKKGFYTLKNVTMNILNSTRVSLLILNQLINYFYVALLKST